MSTLPALSFASIGGILAVAAIAVIIFLMLASSTRNLYFGDWWARTFKMRTWRERTTGIDNRASWEKTGMPVPERELSDYYRKYASAVDRRTFDNASEWLKLSGQGGIKPAGLWVWAILFLLTIGEAAGTGMLLAGSISNKITANEVAPFGFVVAAILAFGLLWLTHAAGKEASFGSAIKQHLGTSVASEKFGVRKISPTDDFRIDEGVDDNRRFANRALNGDHHRASRWGRIACVVILSLLVASIFGIRYYNNQQEYENKVMDLVPASPCGAQNDSSDPFANMSHGSNIPGFAPGTPAPPSVNCNATSTSNKGQTDRIRTIEISKDISAGVLALLYVIVQFIGFVTAWRHSFFGEGSKAFAITQGYPNYDELYRHRLEPAFKLGNVALQSLRNQLMRRVNSYRDNPSQLSIQEYAFRSQYKVDVSMTAEEVDNKIGIDAFKASQQYRENLARSGLIVKPAASLTKYSEMCELEEHSRHVDVEIKRLQGEGRLQRARDEVRSETVIDPIAPQPQPKAHLREAQQKLASQPPARQVFQPPSSELDMQQSQDRTKKLDLSAYNIMDIEAAEEMLKASSVLERRHILNELSEADESKKILIQEIYAKLKNVSDV